MLLIRKILTLVILVSFTNFSWALKPSGHVYVAQEIINELKENNGALTFTVVDGNNASEIRIQLSQAKVNYILENQHEFRAGSIGPDASPDMLIGQMFIHPGTPIREDGLGYAEFGADENWNNAWTTDDWIRYLDSRAINNNEKSYLNGVRVHAAIDMIAHTYVNTYAGNVFRLEQHKEEPIAELRHILVEAFIDHFTPGLGNGVEEYKDSVRLPKIEGAIESYNDAVAAVNAQLETAIAECNSTYSDLIAEGEINSEYNLQICISIANIEYNSDRIPTVDTTKSDYIHRVFMYDKETVEKCVAEDVNLIGSADGVIHNIRLSKVMKQLSQDLSAKHFTSIYNLRYQIEEVLQSLWLDKLDTDVMKHFIYWWTDQEPTILLDGISQRLREITIDQAMEIKEVVDQINTVLGKTTLKHNEFVIDEVKKIENAMAKVGQLNMSILNLKQQIDAVHDDLDNKVCKWTTPHWLCSKIKKLKRKLRGLETSVLENTNELIFEKNIISSALEKVQALMKGLYYVNQDLNGESNPVRALLSNWAEGIDGAMSRYSDVGLGMMISTMDPDQGMLDPLRKWAFDDCDLNRLLGLESGEGPGCILEDKLAKIQESLDFLYSILMPGGDPILASIKSDIEKLIKEKIEAKLKKVEDDLKERLDAKIDEKKAKYPEYLAMYDIMNDLFNISSLAVKLEIVFNARYYQPLIGNESKYLSIEQAAQKLMREMRLIEGEKCNGKQYCFDVDEYPVVYNSIVMSKLALLESEELSELAGKLSLPEPNSLSNKPNIFDKSLFSIDGERQWAGEKIPPYIGKDGKPRIPWVLNEINWFIPLEYENDAESKRPYASSDAMMFGSQSNTRKIFKKLLKGPLNEAIFEPGKLPALDRGMLTNYVDNVGQTVVDLNARLEQSINGLEEEYGIEIAPLDITFDSLFNNTSGKEVKLHQDYLDLYNECEEQAIMFWLDDSVCNNSY